MMMHPGMIQTLAAERQRDLLQSAETRRKLLFGRKQRKAWAGRTMSPVPEPRIPDFVDGLVDEDTPAKTRTVRAGRG